MDKVVEKLKQLNTITPREDWVQSNRDLLLSQITSQAPVTGSSVFGYLAVLKLLVPFRLLNFVARPVGIAVLVLLMLVVSGGFTVSAAKKSLPGEFLYSVKLTSEKVQVGLATSEEGKVKVYAALAEERVREIERIVAMSVVDKSGKIKVATDGLKQQMSGVRDNLAKVKDKKDEPAKVSKSMGVVKEIDKKVGEISERLKLSAGDTDIDLQTYKEIEEAAEDMDDTGVIAVSVIVNKYDSGEADLPAEEVVEAVSQKLQQANDNLKEVTEKVEAVAAMEAAAEELEPTVEDSEVGQVVDDEASAVDAEVVEGSVDVAESNVPEPQVVEALLDEAEELLQQGDLVAAIEKIQEGNQLTEQVEDSLDEKVLEEVSNDPPAENVDNTTDSGEAVDEVVVESEEPAAE